MATELEAAVIAAAKVLYHEGVNDHWTACALVVAVGKLLEAEAAPETEAWGRLVSGDQIWSEKVGKWFEVLEVRTAGGRTTALLAGGVRFTKPAGETVKVKRSDLGLAMDRFETLWSGPNGART